MGLKIYSTPPDFLDGREQLEVRIFFQQVSIRTSRNSLLDILFLSVHTQNQYFHVGIDALDAGDRLDTSETRHGYVNNGHIRLQRQQAQKFKKFKAIAYLPGDLQVTSFPENPLQIMAKNEVVIGQNNPVRAFALQFFPSLD